MRMAVAGGGLAGGGRRAGAAGGIGAGAARRGAGDRAGAGGAEPRLSGLGPGPVRAAVQAAADLRRALELWAKVPPLGAAVDSHHHSRFEPAQPLALLAGLGKDTKSGVTTVEAASFADQAVAALRDAINAGWTQLDELKEPDFDALRGRDDFQKLLAELEAKSGPKAKSKD